VLHNARALPAALRAAPPPRLVHAWDARSLELAWLAARRLGIPAAGTLHDHPFAAHHGLIRRWLMRAAANRLAALVPVSDAVADACRHAGYRCPLTVIRNGLADSAPTRVASPRVRLSFLGMRTPGKGFAVIAPWIRRTSDLNVEWRLHGDIAPHLRAQAEALAAECAGRVVLTGHVSADEAFANTDILVHASTDFDSLPTVLIEAARAGVPALASHRGGAPEIVSDGVTGFLFDPARPDAGFERLRALVTDAPLRDGLGAAARQRFVASFGVRAMADAYARFWDELAPSAQ
jgi:glycosyltransferase involved in cell wall biosynthesis